MTRRATYQFSNGLASNARQGVGSGLGKAVSGGAIGLIPPTDHLTRTGQHMTVDGVRIVFQLAHGADAPSEMMFHCPDKKALCLSEESFMPEGLAAESAKRYVAALGGEASLLAIARKAFDAGDYRWVAELVNHAVFADPSSKAARDLQADTLEQLGYQAEADAVKLEGNPKAFGAMFANVVTFDPFFDIVTP